jgi:hypothetical protein
MKHAAALLLVGTLSGTPVADLACISLCHQNASAGAVTCHHNMASTASLAIRDADDSCAQLFVSVLFLREEVQRPACAVVPASAPHAASVIAGEEALLASTHWIAPGAPALEPMRVLRL